MDDPIVAILRLARDTLAQNTFTPQYATEKDPASGHINRCVIVAVSNAVGHLQKHSSLTLESLESDAEPKAWRLLERAANVTWGEVIAYQNRLTPPEIVQWFDNAIEAFFKPSPMPNTGEGP